MSLFLARSSRTLPAVAIMVLRSLQNHVVQSFPDGRQPPVGPLTAGFKFPRVVFVFVINFSWDLVFSPEARPHVLFPGATNYAPGILMIKPNGLISRSEFIRFALRTPSKSFGKYVSSLGYKVNTWDLPDKVINHGPCVWRKWCTHLYIIEGGIVNSLNLLETRQMTSF